MGNVIANLIMDEALDDILLMSAHDDPAYVRVIWLRPQVPWVRRISAVFEGNKMVLLITSHVVGMRNAPGAIDLAVLG